MRANTAEDPLEAEHARSEALLADLLPTEIAARMAPDDLVRFLNRVFTAFDDLTARHTDRKRSRPSATPI